jgi:hypothetical protein
MSSIPSRTRSILAAGYALLTGRHAFVGGDLEVDGNLEVDGPIRYAGAASHPVVTKYGTITETAGAGTYTLSFSLPAGATLLDLGASGVALWTNAGAVVLKAGDTDDDGYFTAVDLKATDLLAGEEISIAGGAGTAGGKEGAYIAGSQVNARYSASARTISFIVSAASTGGGAGRTRCWVRYIAPTSGDITAATKA